MNVNIKFNGWGTTLNSEGTTVTIEDPKGENKLPFKDFLKFICTNLIKGRQDMLMKGETLRPGILVIVNDNDWETLGSDDMMLQKNDEVVFISTLHGG